MYTRAHTCLIFILHSVLEYFILRGFFVVDAYINRRHRQILSLNYLCDRFQMLMSNNVTPHLLVISSCNPFSHSRAYITCARRTVGKYFNIIIINFVINSRGKEMAVSRVNQAGWYCDFLHFLLKKKRKTRFQTMFY